ncbi:hypothetical protein H0H92_011731 [Tricholoma furcatifolium]|nr:hypothetical protein H0H92_011731 [Tricholoma furcatifolium]
MEPTSSSTVTTTKTRVPYVENQLDVTPAKLDLFWDYFQSTKSRRGVVTSVNPGYSSHSSSFGSSEGERASGSVKPMNFSVRCEDGLETIAESMEDAVDSSSGIVKKHLNKRNRNLVFKFFNKRKDGESQPINAKPHSKSHGHQPVRTSAPRTPLTASTTASFNREFAEPHDSGLFFTIQITFDVLEGLAGVSVDLVPLENDPYEDSPPSSKKRNLKQLVGKTRSDGCVVDEVDNGDSFLSFE